jgi:hypothetical protein
MIFIRSQQGEVRLENAHHLVSGSLVRDLLHESSVVGDLTQLQSLGL